MRGHRLSGLACAGAILEFPDLLPSAEITELMIAGARAGVPDLVWNAAKGKEAMSEKMRRSGRRQAIASGGPRHISDLMSNGGARCPESVFGCFIAPREEDSISSCIDACLDRERLDYGRAVQIIGMRPELQFVCPCLIEYVKWLQTERKSGKETSFDAFCELEENRSDLLSMRVRMLCQGAGSKTEFAGAFPGVIEVCLSNGDLDAKALAAVGKVLGIGGFEKDHSGARRLIL
jgi:hypothetical protein